MGLHNMFARLRKLLGSGTQIEAASALPPPIEPKAPRKSVGWPSLFKTTTPDASQPIRREDRRLTNLDLMTLRNGRDTFSIIRDFAHSSPNLSSAVWSYLRLGIPDRFTVVAKNLDGTFNAEATSLAQQIMVRFDLLPDYSQGYSVNTSLRSTSEQLAKELVLYGSCSSELVLGKDLLPRRIQPISTTQIEWYPDKDKTLRPRQVVGNEKVDLDIPTFFYESLDQDLLDTYSSSPLETAIKPTLFLEDFMQDVHHIIKKVIHPRQKVKVDEERFRRYLSPEAQVDPVKAREELNALIAQIQSQVNNLRPEDALVYLDSIGFEVETPSNAGLAQEYDTISGIANSRLASGSKVMGTVLGFQSGSSNIASVETMLFVKAANGAVKAKLDEMYSRIFTLAVRLFGVDAYVEFRYDAIDLRPEGELEAFKQTKQMRVLEQLSLGMITDEEASIAITGHLPPPGAPKLSGTMFKSVGGGAAIQTPTNSGSTLNQNLNPETPTTGRGQNRRADVLPLRSEA
jgi:hypothetical protein